MKLTDHIKLNTTVSVADEKGRVVQASETRSVADEIKRLRDMGAFEAAQRLENSCKDRPGLATVSVNPVDGKKFEAASVEEIAK